MGKGLRRNSSYLFQKSKRETHHCTFAGLYGVKNIAKGVDAEICDIPG